MGFRNARASLTRVSALSVCSFTVPTPLVEHAEIYPRAVDADACPISVLIQMAQSSRALLATPDDLGSLLRNDFKIHLPQGCEKVLTHTVGAREAKRIEM